MIRESQSLEITYDQTSTWAQLRIATMDRGIGSSNISSNYMVTWTINDSKLPYPFYVNSTMGYFSNDNVERVARGLVADTDEFTDTLRKIMSNSGKLES